MNARYERLRSLLMKLFQLDQPDLDFGIYRVIHAKRAEVTRLLDDELLPQIGAAFVDYKSSDKAVLQLELEKAIDQGRALGADPEALPRVQQLRASLAEGVVDLAALEAEVFDHLYRFFSRYYSEGDFLSLRRYKQGVYALPYEGEEVKVYWANHDQYYIKTSEYLRDYAFLLRPEDEADVMRVHFRLATAAEGEHGTVKESDGKGRVFMLVEEDGVSVESGNQGAELVINFEYRSASVDDWAADMRAGKTKPPTQADLLADAERRLLGLTDSTLSRWVDLLRKPYSRTDGSTANYSSLRAHLNRYAARNTFDYFVHKDLGGFLRRELDFYIKNEVMFLDDIDMSTAPRVDQYLSKIKVIRGIAGKIIDFLAQLEDFQKKLWLKKKFVTETSWCVSLATVAGIHDDSVRSRLLDEIADNVAQREEWVQLHAIHEFAGDLVTPAYSVPLTVAFLQAHPTLMIDTRLFSTNFSGRLLEGLSGLDELVDGVFLHGDNFQALRLMGAGYRGRVDCVYADPPFNTDASEIMYKNDYKHSSWMTLIDNRVRLAARLMRPDSSICMAIDDAELTRLIDCLEGVFGARGHLATVPVRSNPHGRAMASGFSANHEYALFFSNGTGAEIGRLPRSEKKMTRYPHHDAIGPYTWINFRKTGVDSRRADRPKQYYPVFVSDAGTIRIPAFDAFEGGEWVTTEVAVPGETAVWPIDGDGSERVWSLGWTRAREECASELSSGVVDGSLQIQRKYRPHHDGAMPGTWWEDAKYSATESGTKILNDLFGDRNVFPYPKSVGLMEDCLRVLACTPQTLVLDFFGGSGTTAHAVWELNRQDGGFRKCVLVEAGAHFDGALIPRMKKVAFTGEWKNGKPKRLPTTQDAERSPRIFKLVRLESYEDTLMNLDLNRSESQQSLLDNVEAQGADGLREQYILRYMLDVEARGSQSILNIDAFADPAAYRLKIKRPGSDESGDVCVDLAETFAWLLGLRVSHMSAPHSFSADFKRDSEGRLCLGSPLRESPVGCWWFRTVRGTMPDGRKALVIWRNCLADGTPGGAEKDSLVLDEWFTLQVLPVKCTEFDIVYVNGDNNLQSLKPASDTWKVRLIEEDFARLMFDVDGA